MEKPDEESTKDKLANREADYVASAAKAALGMIPFAGSLLAEIAGTIIPNQRIERIVGFAGALEKRLKTLEKDFVRSQVTNENFTDLVEEGLRQAARSLSEDRREYIASLIANSLKPDAIEHAESKHLLRIMGELNDIEILWLRFYLDPHLQGDEEFRKKHEKVFEPIAACMGDPESVIDKEALQRSYREHLSRLGLLEPRYEMENSTFGTKLKAKGYELTWFGRVMLKAIGLAEDTE